jgi:cell division protein FtsZ
METPNETSQAQPINRKPFTIRVFGIGGAGCNAVNHIARQPIDGIEFYALNTDAAALGQLAIANRMILGEKLTRGMGAGGDPDRGAAAAEEDAVRLKTLCTGVDIVFIAAGMGGGTGTGAAPVVARIAKECGALVLGMTILPFEWEGTRRHRQANMGLLEMKKAADGVICLPNQKLFALVDEKTSMVETFAIAHELLADGVRGVWRMLMRPGLINVDFADLCSVTRNQHSENTLATAEAMGDSRAKEVFEKLLKHPLLDGGDALNDASSVLVSLVGGPDLTMADVNRVMQQLNRQCESAHIMMGAAVEESFAGKLAVTIVASRRVNQPKEEPLLAGAPELEKQLVDTSESSDRGNSRFVAPAPTTSWEAAQKVAMNGARGKKKLSKLKQGTLPLEIISKGRFEKSEPTIHQGQDLDVPTYIRRGVPLN